MSFQIRFKNMVPFLLSSLMLACAQQDDLQPLEPVLNSSAVTNSVNVDFCTPPAYDQKQYLKYIIILDHSTSNQQNGQMLPDGSGNFAVPLNIQPALGTDPTGQLRYGNVATPGTLLNYLANLPANNPADPERFFARIDFSTNYSTFPNPPGFTTDIMGFYNQIQNDATGGGTGVPNDNGFTNYFDTLNQAYDMINQDIQDSAACAALPTTTAPFGNCYRPGVEASSSYVVIFMTDGAPIVNLVPNPDGSVNMTKQPALDILTLVNNLVALGRANPRYVTSINLFTIFYYNPLNAMDNSAIDLLASMARVGNGIAYTAVAGSNIDYTQFQPPKKRISFGVSDIFVTNESVAWWQDGTLHPDTDKDGLPDDVETAWGSDPANPRSGGNGVLDLVKYYDLNGGNYRVRNYSAAGQPCAGVPRSGVLYQSQDPNGLNDCEKRILGNSAGLNNPDSNGDLIPDWLEFKNGIPFQVGTAPAVNTPMQDGYTIYQKVKFSLPQTASAQQMLTIQPARYDLQLVSSTADQDCYRIRVTDLPVIGNNNSVRVDIIMKSDLLQATYLYKVGTKQFANGSNTVDFRDWLDPAEIAAFTWQEWQ